jgi:hypothetical protein
MHFFATLQSSSLFIFPQRPNRHFRDFYVTGQGLKNQNIHYENQQQILSFTMSNPFRVFSKKLKLKRKAKVKKIRNKHTHNNR